MDEHGCWISYKTYPGSLLRFFIRCRCGWKGPERYTRAETLPDRAAHKAAMAEDSAA
jgi:hypothetical protein